MVRSKSDIHNQELLTHSIKELKRPCFNEHGFFYANKRLPILTIVLPSSTAIL